MGARLSHRRHQPRRTVTGRLGQAHAGGTGLRSAPRGAPAALRTAPAPVSAAAEPGQLLDALLAPARSGILLTGADLREAAAARAGLGYRVGERRFALRAMLDQDAEATLGWLAGHASRWAARHAAQQPVAGPDPRH